VFDEVVQPCLVRVPVELAETAETPQSLRKGFLDIPSPFGENGLRLFPSSKLEIPDPRLETDSLILRETEILLRRPDRRGRHFVPALDSPCPWDREKDEVFRAHPGAGAY